jgi:hypothetical protein
MLDLHTELYSVYGIKYLSFGDLNAKRTRISTRTTRLLLTKSFFLFINFFGSYG